MKRNRLSAYVELLDKRGKIFLISFALLMITAIVGIVLVKIDTGFSAFMPRESDAISRIEKMNQYFGGSEQLIVLIESDGSVGDLKKLAELTAEIAILEDVDKAEPPIPASVLNRPVEQVEASVSMMNEVSNGRILMERDDGGFWTMLKIFPITEVKVGKFTKKLEEMLAETGRAFFVSGEVYLQGKLFSYILKIVIFLPPIAIILLLLVFVINLKSFRATALSLLPGIIGAVLTLGLLSWVYGEISVASVLTPFLVIVLGSANGLHITSHIVDRLREGAHIRTAIYVTLNEVGTPVVLATLTTMAGFLSMLLIKSETMQIMGIGASIGILLSGVAAWVMIPLLLLRQKPLKVKPKTKESAVLIFFRRVQGWPAITITALIIGVATFGAINLKSDFSMLDIFKKNTEVHRNMDQMTDITGGAMPVALIYPATSALDITPEKALLEFEQRVTEAGLASEGNSIYSFLGSIVKAQMNMDEIPSEPFMRQMLLSRVKQMNPNILENFYSSEGYGRAMYSLVNLNGATLEEFEEIAGGVSAVYGVNLEPVSNAFAMKDMNDMMIHQQIRSLILAVLLVLVISIITQRSLKLGIFSTLPVAVTLLGLFGYMGYMGIKLSIVSGMMMGITVGVGIDYAIHFSSLYRYMRKSGNSAPASAALKYVATPVIANASGLAIGFTALALSPFQIHSTLTQIMWVTMTLASFLALSMLPTILGIKKDNGQKLVDAKY